MDSGENEADDFGAYGAGSDVRNGTPFVIRCAFRWVAIETTTLTSGQWNASSKPKTRGGKEGSNVTTEPFSDLDPHWCGKVFGPLRAYTGERGGNGQVPNSVSPKLKTGC